MVCNPFFQEFVLLALLWQVVISEWTRKQSQAPQHPFPQRTTRPPKGAKPVAGLTKKPHCLNRTTKDSYTSSLTVGLSRSA